MVLANAIWRQEEAKFLQVRLDALAVALRLTLPPASPAKIARRPMFPADIPRLRTEYGRIPHIQRRPSDSSYHGEVGRRCSLESDPQVRLTLVDRLNCSFIILLQ